MAYPPADPPPDPVVPVRSCDGADEDRVDAKRMSLGDHLAELRQRLIVSLLAFGAVFLLGMVLYPWLWEAVRLPLAWAPAVDGRPLPEIVQFQWPGPLEGFLTILKIDVLFTIVMTFPFLAYQVWLFVVPGLTRQERRALRAILSVGSLLFFLGVFVAFRYATGLGMRFLVEFNQSLAGSSDQWRGDYYLGFLTMVCLGFGIGFETPLVMLALARVGLITPESILHYWRHALLGMVVLGAIFTPPDPFTQILLALIMTCLFFLGYLLARWFGAGPIAPGEAGDSP